jgi:hypothetical protein
VVSGLASISAPFIALFIQFVPNVADQISKAAPWAIYGVFLIGFMYLMPTGVASFFEFVGEAATAFCRAGWCGYIPYAGGKIIYASARSSS